jgi:hypothetical protein
MFAMAALTKHHRLSGLSNINLLSQNSGVRESKTKVPIGLVSAETSLFGLQIASLYSFSE